MDEMNAKSPSTAMRLSSETEIEDIDRRSREFFRRYKKHYHLSVIAALFVIAISASMAALVHMNTDLSKWLVSGFSALAAFLSSIDPIFGCKDRARRHLRAFQELDALKDEMRYEEEKLLSGRVEEALDKTEALASLLKRTAREKHRIVQTYLRIDKPEGWLDKEISEKTSWFSQGET